ncbi:zinc finger protein PLAGL2-like [Corythoichthys intestinalis]|uniref:zinc finger protein PLAGL2-like n=1 Tax=Corythoichthys intestinalis TaxID=161448 RepID=UPI0025A4E0CA|nr:zinc finger protein PLAGL2-like [Corythoichthys intestinalis]XP_061803572.1 zinc finger protein PLAGL2-like [Nerophis lumbriciformis]
MFHQQEQLKSQLEDSHLGNRQLGFHCQECGKQYNTQLGYRRHLVEAHSAGAGLTCSEGAPSLLEHLGGGHIDRPPPEGNNNAVVSVRERKYSCERCDRRFYTRKDVRRHAVVHTGRRDFLCPRCAQRFGRRDHLTRHLKKSHAHDAGLIPLVTASTPVETSTPTNQGPVKESSPSASDRGSSTSTKEPVETFTRDMFNSYPITNPVSGMSHPHGLMQVSMGVGRHMPPPSPHNHHHHLQPLSAPQQQSYSSMPRYQQGSTSYPRTDVDSFLLDLQGAPPPHLSSVNSSTSTSSSPQREMLAEGMAVNSDPHLVARNPELSCTTNMELGPLLGFLPFGLPPYSSHVGMGGLMMGYPAATTATSSPSSTTGLSSQSSGPFTFFQPPQAHVPQGPVAHNHSQLPQAYSTSAVSTSSPLPHYYQAFQQ